MKILNSKNQMLSSNNDVSTHAKKNAKREVKEILESFKRMAS